MNTVLLVLAIAFVAGVFVVGARSRKRQSKRPPRKTAQQSTGRNRKQKTTKQRKPRFNFGDNEDLVEMLFENVIGERNKRK